jgi:hypothetical protein
MAAFAEPTLPKGQDAPVVSKPGYQSLRLANLIREAVVRCELDLSGLTVLTEAASGAYATTCVAAAVAGARQVFARARHSRFGTVAQVKSEIQRLAQSAGVTDRIRIFDGPYEDILPEVDILTNSGHLRPITSEVIERLPARAVISLMFEIWEFRAEDLDLPACRRRGIPVVGVNERHPAVDVFSFLGPLAVKLLNDAGSAVYGSRISLLCDNPFQPFIERSLAALGAEVTTGTSFHELTSDPIDVILVALRPREVPVLNAQDAALIAERQRGAFVAQFWGDVDRSSLAARGIPTWPPVEPEKGHMAILLSELGPEPIVRLQIGGLRAAELIYRQGDAYCETGGVAEVLKDNAGS